MTDTSTPEALAAALLPRINALPPEVRNDDLRREIATTLLMAEHLLTERQSLTVTTARLDADGIPESIGTQEFQPGAVEITPRLLAAAGLTAADLPTLTGHRGTHSSTSARKDSDHDR